MLEISEKDILRSKLITPGFYRVHVDDVGEALSKAGDSTNWTIAGTILFNADNGDKEFAGVPTPYWNFNSKAPGFFAGALNALGEEVKAGRYDPKALKGKEFDIFIRNEMYENRMVNRFNHEYRKPRDL